ncbi:hypothetical protein K492DRAFT_206539 [Lichtheimia hyalospora FSU 10163]|nr:hypothetical protein K492DRAFT_206539 [Lichtheimia hyalospora FSU 10163]
MDNAIVPDSSLVTEWTKAIVNVDLERAQRLYSQHPYLLWHPLDNKETRVDTDYAHLTAQLERFQMLGPTLGDHLAAIPYMLLDHLEKTDKQGASLAQQKRSRLLAYLIKNAREDDLNNRTWGTCHNTTLHLAAFLGQARTMDQLIERGASIDKRNDNGHLPNDVAQKRPTNSRFRQLRAMAESTPDDPNKNKRQSTQQRRQQDIALLSKKSAVKNNPLFKKFEQQQQQSDSPLTKKPPSPSPLARNAFLKSTGGSSNSGSSSNNNNDSSNSGNTKLLAIPRGVLGDDDNGEANSEDYPRRTSKIISSLKNKSYVSSSVFRQTQPEQPSSRNIAASAVTKSSPLKEQSIIEEEETNDNENDQGKDQTQQMQEQSSKSNNDLATPEIKVVPSLLVEQVAPEPSHEEDMHETKKLVQEDEDMHETVQEDESVHGSNKPVQEDKDMHESKKPIQEDENMQQTIELAQDDNSMQQTMEQDVSILHKEHDEDQVIKTGIEIPPQEEETDKGADNMAVSESTAIEQEHREEITTQQPDVDTSNKSIQHVEHQQQETARETNDAPVTRDPIAALDDLEPPSKPFAEGDDSRRWSGSQRSHWSVGVSSWDAVLSKDNDNHRHSNQSEADSEQWFDSYEDWAASSIERRGSRPRQQIQHEEPSLSSSPLRHSVTLDTISSMNDHEKEYKIHIAEDDQDDDEEEDSVKSSNASASFSPNQRMSGGADSVDTWPATASPFTARSINDDSGDDDGFWKTQHEIPVSEQPVTGQSIEPTLRQVEHPSLEQLEQEKVHSNKSIQSEQIGNQHQQQLMVSNESHYEQHEDQQFGSISVASTTYASHRLPQHRPVQDAFEEFITRKDDDELQLKEPEQRGYQPRLESDQEQMIIREQQQEQQQQPVSIDQQPQPQAVSNDHKQAQPLHEQHQEVSSPLQLELLPPVENDPGQSTSAFGKLYVRLSSADGVLLPVPPKLTTYVRCVVSDGDYEYMSRYEVLDDRVIFDYECIMDARPDMIITVSLHVRPDPHVRPKTGLSKWLTSVRKQRETLPAYVHPEDGAIGQTRFALGHMIQACNQKTYGASFDCFNSWFARSSREQHMLKVVGNLNVEMLYLPLSDPSLPIPKSMRECDLALRIRQWHNTCWHSGFLSTRAPGSQLWDRHYCRLIGSQLIGYESKAASASYSPQVQYDIANAVRLVASSDQVIVALEDIPDTRVFQENTIVEETGRGFFRIVFADAYVDCVCDEAHESEAWVKILKSMIGRVPLKIAV